MKRATADGALFGSAAEHLLTVGRLTALTAASAQGTDWRRCAPANL